MTGFRKAAASKDRQPLVSCGKQCTQRSFLLIRKLPAEKEYSSFSAGILMPKASLRNGSGIFI